MSISQKLGVRAQLETKGALKEIPTEMDLPVIPGGTVSYRIVIRLNPEDIVMDRNTRIHVSFNKYFVPKRVGMNEDQRELVIMAPKTESV